MPQAASAPELARYADAVTTPWLNPAEERAWRALQLLQLRLEAEMARDLQRSSDLTYAEYLVLVALTGAERDALRLHELATMLSWETSRTSHQVARMTRRGLLDRRTSAQDRRGCEVSATDRGRAAIEAAAPAHLAAVRRLFFDHLSADEVAAIGDAAAKVLEATDPPGDLHHVG